MSNDQPIDPTTDTMLSPRRRPHLFVSGKSAAIKGLVSTPASQDDGTGREPDISMRGKSVDSVHDPDLRAKFERGLAELIHICHGAGLHSSEMIEPLRSELRWAVTATRISDGG